MNAAHLTADVRETVDAATGDGLVRSAQRDGGRALLRLPVSVVVSGFLFAFVGVTEGVLWLAAVLSLEIGDGFVRRRLSAGDLRYRNLHLALILAISLCWVAHALMLWRVGGEVPRIAALMDLFTVALYGAIGGRADRRLLLALLAPPLVALVIMLMFLLWTTTPPWVASFASIATLGACATILLNGLEMHRSDRALALALADLNREREALEERVAQRTRELSVAARAAEAANVAKTQFLATMSHELRTPLNAVIGYAELLRDELRMAPATARPGDAERIAAAGQHLLGLINDVLDLSQIEAGSLRVSRAPTELAGVLQEAAATVAHIAEANRNQVTVIVRGAPGPVVADRKRLFQCVLNLAANACKFTSDGDVRIEADVEGQGDAAMLTVSVIDTGCGIAPDKLAEIFEPFTQAESGATRRHDGAGLGLAITRRLARLMGGDVSATSAPGQGSTFRLTLPAG